MLVNWKINFLEKDNDAIQPPDKFIRGQKYWFFRYWPDQNIEVNVIDYSSLPLLHNLEKDIFKFYISQAISALSNNLKKYDLIISHSAQSAVLLAFIRSLQGKKYPPHIVIDPASFNGGRNNFLELLPIKICVRSITGIIYHSTKQYEYYRKHFPFLIEKTKFIPFGVDTNYFAPMELPISSTILSFGEKKRDYKTLLSAWAQLNIKHIELNIVGIKSVKNLGLQSLPNNIKIFPKVSIDVLKKMIAQAIFIIIPLPYYEYSYGQMSILQSMSMGKLVITTKTPSTVDYINDGEDAILVEPNNTDDMKNKITHYLGNPSLATRIGQNARLKVVESFSENNMAQQIFNFIKRFL
ncbi:MAG: glycosyltransferase family 4 protein [Bacteroidales bacterium]